MKTINQLRDEIHANAKEKGFWDNPRETGTLLMLCVSELSEAMEADRSNRYVDLEKYYIYRQNEYLFKEKQLNDVKYYPRSPSLIRSDEEIDSSAFKLYIKDTFEDELADAILRILDLCGSKGIDIEKHVELKMKYNQTRERMHGKKY